MIEQHLKTIDDANARENIRSWLEGSCSDSEKNAVLNLVAKSPKEATDAFYKKLEFGTGGIRGIMGIGTNRINAFTVQSAIQALANYLKRDTSLTAPSVMIGYDNRLHSREFAEYAARVLAGNGIKAMLAKNIRPTPYLSFCMRQKKCDAGCMITASHNPKEYNGFKVYWNDGGQVLFPHESGIIEEFDKITNRKDIKIANTLDHPLIEEFEEEMDAAYIDAITGLECYPIENQKFGNTLRIVYTSLHGTGSTVLPKLFKKWGFGNVSLVEKQCIPDGNFQTLNSPDPQDKDALKCGIEECLRVNADLLIATDPDADRVGIVVKHQGSLHILDGNQIAVLLADHVFANFKKKGGLKENAACLKSIVTTELFRKIAKNYGIACFDLLPGFKYVAEKIRLWESGQEHQFILAAEESFGYLFGTLSRDKDAVVSSLLLAELALKAKLENQTLIDILDSLTKKYGYYFEKQYTVKFQDTKEGRESMKRAMDKIRRSPPLTLCKKKALKVGDLTLSFFTDLSNGKKEEIFLPKTDMIILYYDEGQTLMIRPSGTEPKIKIYLKIEKQTATARENLESEAEAIFKEMSSFFKE